MIDSKSIDETRAPCTPLMQLSRVAFRSVLGLPSEEYSDGAVDPDQVLKQARAHRVIGLLQAGEVFTTDSFKTAAWGQAVHSARLTAMAESLFTALEEASLPALLIKGPALAAQAWPASGIRAFDDLDLRCRAADWERVEQVVCAHGFEPDIPSARTRSHYWRYGWGLTYRHTTGSWLELNHRYFAAFLPAPHALHDIGGAILMQQPLDSRSVTALTPAAHLVLCSTHAIWHGGERLAWFADIAALLARKPDALSEAIAMTAKDHFARTSLQTACAVAARLFGSSLLDGYELTATQPEAEGLILAQLAADGPPDRHAQRHLHELCLNRVEHVRYRVKRAFIPGDGDFRAFSLPRPLAWLYWLTRPVRVGISRLARVVRK